MKASGVPWTSNGKCFFSSFKVSVFSTFMDESVSLGSYLISEFGISKSQLLQSDWHLQLTYFLTETRIISAVGDVNTVSCPTSDCTYLEFVDSLISNLCREKSNNVLAYGYADPASSGISCVAINPHVSFNVNLIKLPFWHHLYNIIGRSAFAKMISTARAYRLGHDGNYYQIFGPGLRFRNASRKTDSTNELFVSRVLYRHNPSIYGQSILNNKTATEILTNILQNGKPSRRTLKACLPLKKLLEVAIQRDAKQKYHCIYASVVNSVADSNDPTPVHLVLKFVLIVISRIMPLTVWGNKANKAAVFRVVALVVFLRAYQRIPADYLFKSVKMTDFPWLGKTQRTTSRQDFERRQRLLTLFLRWVTHSLLNAIITQYWYVTEPIGEDQHLLHFPHQQWHHAADPWFEKYAKNFLQKVDLSRTQIPNSSLFFNFGWMRLLPKKGDFRLLCVPSKVPWLHLGQHQTEAHAKQFRAYDSSMIRPVREIIDSQSLRALQTTKEAYPICHSFRDVAESIAMFKARMVRKRGTEPSFRLLKFDMKYCYDQLDHSKIVECVDSLLGGGSTDVCYHTRTVWECSDDPSRVKKGRTIVRHQGEVHQLQHIDCRPISSRSKLFVDSSKGKQFSKSAIMDIVKSQIYDSFCLARGPKFGYKRTKGVFQGFPLLSCFCNVVYNQMVRDKFAFIFASTSDAVIIRLVDDFLIISTTPEIALECASVISGSALHEYGAYVNEAKTHSSNPLVAEVIKFAGLDIHTSTLSVWRSYPHGSIKFPNLLNSFPKLLEYLTKRFKACLDDCSVSLRFNEREVVLENLKRLLTAILEAFVHQYKLLVKGNMCITLLQFKTFMLEMLCTALKRIQRANEFGIHLEIALVKKVFCSAVRNELTHQNSFFERVVATIPEWLCGLEDA